MLDAEIIQFQFFIDPPLLFSEFYYFQNWNSFVSIKKLYFSKVRDSTQTSMHFENTHNLLTEIVELGKINFVKTLVVVHRSPWLWSRGEPTTQPEEQVFDEFNIHNRVFPILVLDLAELDELD